VLAVDVNNLIENNNGCGTPVSGADPKLAPLANNNGNTRSFALLIGSPAIDAGDDITCAAAPVSNADQRGVTRPQGAHCDIGSYEKVAGTTYTVTNLNDSGAGSLRQAILDANANVPIEDTITFSVSGTILLGTSLPDITDNLVIDGSGQNVTISGQDAYRVLNLNSSMSLALNRLSIIKGLATGTTGGGLYGSGAVVTITYCNFSGNSAGWGGAIALQNSSLTIMDSNFTSNTATTAGGAIALEFGNATILDGTFSSNLSDEAGGAIWIYSQDLTVANSTFYNNNAELYGGGIALATTLSKLTVYNSTFSENSITDVTGLGAGIYNYNSTFSLKNTILANSLFGEDCYNAGTLASDVNNLVESHTGCGTPVSTADPMLRPLANNGGFTQTFSLQVGSPAIDAGDDATCAAFPVDNLDQRWVARPIGTHCDIGSFEAKNLTGVLTLRSIGTYDGYILESTETSTRGGTVNSTLTSFYLGDETGDKQYRSVLSFDTTSLPDDASITKVVLKIRKQGQVGSSPFGLLGVLRADVRKPWFGTSLNLIASDFQAAAQKIAVGTFGATPVSNWYSAILLSSGYPYINKTGTTQFKLYFTKGDNDDNAADYMKFFSGNYATASARPTLIIEYYIP
jgi:hypothetical protein